MRISLGLGLGNQARPPVAQALDPLDLFLPAIEHAAQIEKLDKSAQKNARKFLAHLQSLGFYQGVSPESIG